MNINYLMVTDLDVDELLPYALVAVTVKEYFFLLVGFAKRYVTDSRMARV